MSRRFRYRLGTHPQGWLVELEQGAPQMLEPLFQQVLDYREFPVAATMVGHCEISDQWCVVVKKPGEQGYEGLLLEVAEYRQANFDPFRVLADELQLPFLQDVVRLASPRVPAQNTAPVAVAGDPNYLSYAYGCFLASTAPRTQSYWSLLPRSLSSEKAQLTMFRLGEPGASPAELERLFPPQGKKTENGSRGDANQKLMSARIDRLSEEQSEWKEMQRGYEASNRQLNERIATLEGALAGLHRAARLAPPAPIEPLVKPPAPPKPEQRPRRGGVGTLLAFVALLACFALGWIVNDLRVSTTRLTESHKKLETSQANFATDAALTELQTAMGDIDAAFVHLEQAGVFKLKPNGKAQPTLAEALKSLATVISNVQTDAAGAKTQAAEAVAKVASASKVADEAKRQATEAKTESASAAMKADTLANVVGMLAKSQKDFQAVLGESIQGETAVRLGALRPDKTPKTLTATQAIDFLSQRYAKVESTVNDHERAIGPLNVLIPAIQRYVDKYPALKQSFNSPANLANLYDAMAPKPDAD